MTIYDCLKSDHKKIEGLLDQLVKCTSEDSGESWRGLVKQIRLELIPHSRAEEAVFYNSIRVVDPGNELMRHSYREHLEAETELRTLSGLLLIDVKWTGLAESLRKNLLSHVEKEEGEVFALGKKLFSDEEAEKIGKAFEKLKPEIHDETILGTTADLVANLMPPRVVDSFRRIYGRVRKSA